MATRGAVGPWRSARFALHRRIRDLIIRSPLRRYFLHRYQYNPTPACLGYLCNCINSTRELSGAIVEIGCAHGHPTVFLNRHMDACGIEKPYICVDTFGGFTEDDVDLERRQRGKVGEDFSGFRINNKSWFDKTMTVNGIQRVRAIEADINEFPLKMLGPVSLCFVDVGLYRPVLSALEGVWATLQPGGLVVVDGCVPNNRCDGALEAYRKFVTSHGLPERIVLDKFGVVEKAP